MRVLVVEDERAVARYLRRAFETDGCSVEVTPTAEEALARLATSRVDLLVADIGLPGLDGVTMIKTVRRTDRETAILVVSGRANDEDVVRGLDAGADDLYRRRRYSRTPTRCFGGGRPRASTPCGSGTLCSIGNRGSHWRARSTASVRHRIQAARAVHAAS